MPFGRRSFVVAVLKRGVGDDGGDLSFEAHHAVRIGLRRAGGGDDAIHEVGIADGPLKRLLRAHGETDDGAQMRDLELFGEQAMDGLDVIADGHHGKARPVKRLGRIAGRGGAAVAEELCRHQEELRTGRARDRRRSAIRSRAGSPCSAMAAAWRCPSGGVEMSVGAVDDVRHGQRDAALGLEIGDGELVTLRRSRRIRGGLGEKRRGQ